MPRTNQFDYDEQAIDILKKLAEGKTTSLEGQRAEVLLTTYEEALSIIEAAERFGFSRNTVSSWNQRFQKEGIAGLADRSRSGRPTRTTEEYAEAIEKLLQQPAPYHHSYGWTIPLIRKHTRLKTGINLSDDALRDLLHRLGYQYAIALIEVEAFMGEPGETIQSPRYTWIKVIEERE
jgi:transposase